MKIVGDNLAATAMSESDLRRFDVFSRSAFNRYYYSAFLAIRAALRSIDPRWGRPAHQELPDLLTGAVITKLRSEIKHLKESRQISDSDAARIYSIAASAADELSRLLKNAREVRRVADYEPEEPVTRNDDTACLARCNLTSARGWEQRALSQTKMILKAYADLGLI